MSLDLSVLDDDGAGLEGRPGCAPLAALALFEEDPDNPRFEAESADFAQLVDDVKARGILQPIVVRRLENGRLRIRFGARRYRAALAAGLVAAPYIVTEDPRQFDDYAQVAENERRYPLQPLELAAFAARKIAAGAHKAAVAQRLGMHATALSHLLCLTGDVPPFLLELYHARRCRTPVYLYRLMLLWRRDPRRVEANCAAANEVDAVFIGALEADVRDGGKAAAAGEQPSVPAAEASPAPGASAAASAHGAHRSSSKGAAGQVTGHPGRLTRGQLTGLWQDREVVLDLRWRPSRPDLIFVTGAGGPELAEVPIREIVLTALVGGAK